MLWGGRFGRAPHPDMMALTRSVDVDMRLLPYDAAVTKAHARALAAAGLLGKDALPEIDRVCDALVAEWRSGSLEAQSQDEDVHSVLERELTARLGDIGARIHAGRSRNDLVATDFRLWCRDAAQGLAAGVADLLDAVCSEARGHTETVLPGYTHLQRAQPVSLGFHLLAHGVALARDGRRFLAAADAADVSPLGAGALAGTTLPLDPSIAARELGFRTSFVNAMDAVADRDFALDLVYACAVLGVHLSRFAEEVVLWTSGEFGFATLVDEWSTGSSMMPQKRNPDLAELLRGRSAGGIGDLTAMLTLLKGLPLAYDRDLQEDKAIVFRAVDTAGMAVLAATSLSGALRWHPEAMLAAARRGGAWATDVAEALVTRGVAFREAHHAVGKLVARLEEDGVELADADPVLLTEIHPQLSVDDRAFADPARSVAARDRPGGTSPRRVLEQIDSLTATAQELRSQT